jgi:hypothetical protein
MTRRDLNHRLHDTPFRSFRIHLSDGTIIPVTNAGLVVVAESSAIVPTQWSRDSDGYPFVRRWRTLPLAHIVQFSDADEPGKRRTRKKRSA